MFTRMLGAVSLGLSVAACGELFAEVIEQPRSAVVTMIYNMPGTNNLMRLPQEFPGIQMRSETNDSGVVWTYALDGRDICTFTAHIQEQTAAMTVVWTDADDISKEGEGFICDSVKIVGEESVNSTLEGRPVNRQKVYDKLAASLVNNMPSFQKNVYQHLDKTINSHSDTCHQLGTSADQRACRENTFGSTGRSP